MKTIIACLILTLAVIAASAEAANRYDSVTGLVEFECVQLGGQSLPEQDRLQYSISLAIDSDSTLSVAAISEINGVDNCEAVFDIDSNTLSGELRVIDEIYDVSLQLDAEVQTLSILSLEYLRLGETSLWVVSDGVNELYLGGTVHILHQSDFPLPQPFVVAYEEADLVIFEVDPSAVPTESDDDDVMLAEGESLLSYFSAQTELQLLQFLAQFELTLEEFADLRPEFFEYNLYYLGAASAGFGSGVDSFFAYLANNEFKPVGGLETSADQNDAITGSVTGADVDWDFRIQSLLYFINSGLLAADIRSTIDQWREGRIDLIAAENVEYQQNFPNEYENIFSIRNRNWIPVIESYLATSEVELVLGGVGHFAGPDNVLDLLLERGYTVERFVP